MTTGIERAPIYPEFPSGETTNAQVESLNAFWVVEEHKELLEDLLGLNSETPYRLTHADLLARREQMEAAKAIGHRRSRSPRELAKHVLATVSQMEDEFRRQTLLDIGAGIGTFGEAMARSAKAEVTFVDRDEEALERISRRAGKIVLADGRKLPFEDESFKKVISAFSSIHWAKTPIDSVAALNEAVRVTEVGGSTIAIPLLNSISQRRRLLPYVVNARSLAGEFKKEDRFAIVWSVQEYVLIKSLLKLADLGHCAITWSNSVEPTENPLVSRELYSVVIDKLESVPREVFDDNLRYTQQFMPAEER